MPQLLFSATIEQRLKQVDVPRTRPGGHGAIDPRDDLLRVVGHEISIDRGGLAKRRQVGGVTRGYGFRVEVAHVAFVGFVNPARADQESKHRKRRTGRNPAHAQLFEVLGPREIIRPEREQDVRIVRLGDEFPYRHRRKAACLTLERRDSLLDGHAGIAVFLTHLAEPRPKRFQIFPCLARELALERRLSAKHVKHISALHLKALVVEGEQGPVSHHRNDPLAIAVPHFPLSEQGKSVVGGLVDHLAQQAGIVDERGKLVEKAFVRREPDFLEIPHKNVKGVARVDERDNGHDEVEELRPVPRLVEQAVLNQVEETQGLLSRRPRVVRKQIKLSEFDEYGQSPVAIEVLEHHDVDLRGVEKVDDVGKALVERRGRIASGELDLRVQKLQTLHCLWHRA